MTTLDIYNPDVPRIPGRLGALTPMSDAPTVALSRHIALPAAPDTLQREEFVNLLWGILGNDRYGDCTFAGFVHLVLAIAAILGQPMSAPEAAAVVKAYLTFTHGVDSGCVESSVLALGYKSGICGLKLAGYADGDGGLEQMLQVTAAFGAAYLGVTLTQADMDNFQAGKPWTPTSDKTPIGGHCIDSAEYDKPSGMVKVLTWGVEQLASFEWIEAQMDEFHAAIPADVKTAGAFEGVNWSTLEEELDGLHHPIAA